MATSAYEFVSVEKTPTLQTGLAKLSSKDRPPPTSGLSLPRLVVPLTGKSGANGCCVVGDGCSERRLQTAAGWRGRNGTETHSLVFSNCARTDMIVTTRELVI